MHTKEIQIKDYNYPLPDERIAKFPLSERDSSKLLVYNRGEVSSDTFRSLPNYLPKGALMVFNNTKVIRARLHFRKGQRPIQNSKFKIQNSIEGALIEIFLLEPTSPVEYQENFIATSECSWYCLVGNSKKWKEGLLYGEFQIGGTSYTISAERVAPHGTSFEIRFRWEGGFAFSEVLESLGELPIPPYLNRKTEESDLRTYQTVYSKIKGSVAAPTAGLHFTERVLADLDAHGIEREELTLHVGAGTFKPVKSEEIGDHEMHTEHIAVRLQTIQKLIQHDGKAIAVGTTSVRTLESLYYMGIKAQQLMDAGKDTGDGEELHVDILPVDLRTETVPGSCAEIQHLQDHRHTGDLDLKTAGFMGREIIVPEIMEGSAQRGRQKSSLLFKEFIPDITADHGGSSFYFSDGLTPRMRCIKFKSRSRDLRAARGLPSGNFSH